MALGLSGCSINDALLWRMAATCNNLQAVDLSQTACGDEGVGLLSLHCDLRELSLRACEISDDALHSLSLGALSLRVLDIGWCKQVTDKGVARLRFLTCLKTVTLSKCARVTFGGLRSVCALPSLQDLSAAGLHGLPGTPEEMEAFRLLGTSTKMRTLDVSVPMPPWTVGDRSIAALTSQDTSPPLAQIRLVNCNVTAASGRGHAAHLAQTLLTGVFSYHCFFFLLRPPICSSFGTDSCVPRPHWRAY